MPRPRSPGVDGTMALTRTTHVENARAIDQSTIVRIDQGAIAEVLRAGKIQESDRDLVQKWLSFVVKDFILLQYAKRNRSSRYPKPYLRIRKLIALVNSKNPRKKLRIDEFLMYTIGSLEFIYQIEDDKLYEIYSSDPEEFELNARAAVLKDDYPIETLLARARSALAQAREFSKSESARAIHGNSALRHLSALIHIFWNTTLRRPIRISESSDYVHFAKTVFGLVGEDSQAFETLRSRLKGARAFVNGLGRRGAR